MDTAPSAPASSRPEASTPWLGGHVPALDGVRGLAVLLVLLHHLSIGGNLDYPNRLGRTFFALSRLGWCGVDLFFVLSGFLITGILLDAKGSPRFFRNFYMRRLLRIFPLYYGVLIACFLLLPLAFHRPLGLPREQGWLWTYTSNLYPLFHNDWFEPLAPFGVRFGHFWSLAVEEHFYLVWPLLVFLCSRQTLVRLCLALLLFAPICRLAMLLAGYNPEVVPYVFTPCRVDALAAGALLAALARCPAGLAPLRRPAGLLLLACFAALAALWPFTHLRRSAPSTSVLAYSLLPALFASLLVLLVTSRPRDLLPRSLASRPLTFLGRYSYGIYVYHGLFTFLFAQRFLPVLSIYHRVHHYMLAVLLHAAAAAGVSTAVAVLSYHLYEKRFLALKRFFEYRAPRHAPGAPAAPVPADQNSFHSISAPSMLTAPR